MLKILAKNYYLFAIKDRISSIKSCLLSVGNLCAKFVQVYTEPYKLYVIAALVVRLEPTWNKVQFAVTSENIIRKISRLLAGCNIPRNQRR